MLQLSRTHADPALAVLYLRCLIFLGREKRGDNLWSVGTSRCRPTCCWSLMEDSYLCQSPHTVNLGRVSDHPRSPLQRSTQAACAHPRVPIGAQRGRQRIWICGSPGVARHTRSYGSPRDCQPQPHPLTDTACGVSGAWSAWEQLMGMRTDCISRTSNVHAASPSESQAAAATGGSVTSYVLWHSRPSPSLHSV